jgi:hypothetical protein
MRDGHRLSAARATAIILAAVTILMAILAACASTGRSSFNLPSEGGSDSASTPDAGLPSFDSSAEHIVFGHVDGSLPNDAGAADVFTGPLPGPFDDFPASPILDAPADGGAAPSNSATLFGPADAGAQSGGPCLIEPEVGALYPNNWLRPRFVWTTANTENLFELRLHVGNQSNDLVVYTTENGWLMPQAMWASLAEHSQDVPMTVSVRGGLLQGTTLTNEALGSSGPLGIAPVSAPGTIVYWSILNGQGGSAVLQGFSIGDETVGTVLTPAQIQERNDTEAGGAPCLGCHAATPDGLNVGLVLPYAYDDSIATLGADAAPGLVPTFLTADGRAAMDALGGIPAYSAAYWSAGERIVLLSDVGTDLNWVNLSGTGSAVKGVVARTGDTGLATAPVWTHDGTTIVYVSAGQIVNGRQSGGPLVLYSVPYNKGAGGTATPIPGIAQSGMGQYYPAISPDDKYIVFNSAPGGDNPYNDPADQLYMAPIGGLTSGAPVRLDANDPPACTGKTSPGVTNSWAKWSPSAQYVSVLEKTYYWVVFSSTRYPVGPASNDSPQLYITGVVVDSSGTATTYTSLYLWNQPDTQHNHTPAWNYFQIPPPPPPPAMQPPPP